MAVLDYGTKQHILECMVAARRYVKVFPAKTSIAELKAFNPNGYFISNGPGDPAAMDYAVETVKEILKENKPISVSVSATSCWHWPMISLHLRCTMAIAG